MTRMYPHSRAAFIAASFLLLTTTAVGIAQGASPEFEFRANTIGDPDSITYQGLERFAKIVEKRSNGRVSIALHHSGALGDQVSGIEALQSGTLDFATVETPITTIDPVLGVTALPYVFRGREHVETVLYGFFDEWVEQRLVPKGLRVVSLMEGGFRHITNNVRPIYTPEDLEGITMRTPDSRLRIRTFEHYGADASPLPFPEVYTALQTGTFDGQENPVIWAKTTNFYEVQDYLSLTGHIYTATYVLMSEESYQELPQDLQLLVKQAGREAYEKTVEVGRAADTEVVEFLKEQGMEVNEANKEAFVEASEPIWDGWVSDLEPDDQKVANMLLRLIRAAGKAP